MRFLQLGNMLIRTIHLKRLQRRIVVGAMAIGAMVAVLAAILYFGHAQASGAAEGMLLL
ncbi:MAG: hypothetical protein WBY44_01830 [Bryobacteraceae bacterium]